MNQAIPLTHLQVNSIQVTNYGRGSNVKVHGCTGTDTPLWFNVQLSTSTSEDIEMRICGNEDPSHEVTPVELIEINAAQ